MPIQKTVTLDNGMQMSFHKIAVARVDMLTGLAQIFIDSWPTAEIHDGGVVHAAYRSDQITLPLAALLDADAALVARADTPFAGGAVVPDNSVGLMALKARRWAAVKLMRQAVFDAPLATPFGTFDSDAPGRDSIKEGVLLAMYAVSSGAPTQAMRFTLANNERITLTAAEMLEVGLLLGGKVQAAYDTADALRAAIFADGATAQSIALVTWPPSGSPANTPAP